MRGGVGRGIRFVRFGGSTLGPDDRTKHGMDFNLAFCPMIAVTPDHAVFCYMLRQLQRARPRHDLRHSR